MTYKELLATEHPEAVSKKFIGGCFGCPKRVGYEKEMWCKGKGGGDDATCTMCWNREVGG